MKVVVLSLASFSFLRASPCGILFTSLYVVACFQVSLGTTEQQFTVRYVVQYSRFQPTFVNTPAPHNAMPPHQHVLRLTLNWPFVNRSRNEPGTVLGLNHVNTLCGRHTSSVFFSTHIRNGFQLRWRSFSHQKTCWKMVSLMHKHSTNTKAQRSSAPLISNPDGLWSMLLLKQIFCSTHWERNIFFFIW